MENINPLVLVLILGTINWFSTAFGSSFVFFERKKSPISYSNILAVSAGIMLSASFWSLLLPAVEMAGNSKFPPWFVVGSGFIIGIIFLSLISQYSENFSKKNNSSYNNFNMLILAISIHNIPEGFIVGVLVSGFANGTDGLTFLSIISLSLSIGLQNIPEGLAVAFPLKISGKSKLQSFNIAQLTGFIELVSALIGYLFVSKFPSLLPYSLAFSGGAMIYVVIDELIPASQFEKNKKTILWFSLGFLLMMILDTILA